MTLNWPSWRPDQELRAADLRELEDYLLTRSQFIDDFAYGLEFFDWRNSLLLEPGDDKADEVVISVTDLAGVTKLGQPVWVQAHEKLEARVKSAPRQDFEFDLSIDVDPKDAEGKLKLLLEPSPHQQWLPGGRAELYLGRYRRVWRDSRLELVHFPSPRRFAGFGPMTDPQWNEWTQPLRERLEAAFRDAENRTDGSASSGALISELARLCFEWPLLTIPILTQRLRMAAWLRERTRNAKAVPDHTPISRPFLFTDVASNQLPKELARLLPLERQESEDIGKSFKKLLDVLSEEGVDYHAPLAAFREWAEYVETVKPYEAGSKEADAVTRQVNEALVERSAGQIDNWTRAVACVTVLAVKRLIEGWNGPLPQNLAPYLTNSNDVLEGTTRVLSTLYMERAQGARSGPLAFYWLARAATQQRDLTIGSQPVHLYLTNMNRSAARSSPTSRGRPASESAKGVPFGANAKPAAKEDRVLSFLSRANEVPDESSVEPYLWDERGLTQRCGGSTLRDIRITVCGGRRSGKSTIIRELVSAYRESPDLLPLAAVQLVSGNANGPACELEAKLPGRSLQRDVHVTEPAGSPESIVQPDDRLPEQEWPDLWRDAAHSDLLILAIPPTTVDREAAAQVAMLQSLALWAVRRRPSALVALAYTKSDEYGVIDANAIRMIQRHHQVAEWHQKLEPGKWKSFIEGAAITSVSSQNRKEGKGNFFNTQKTSTSGDTGEWAPTRRKAIEQTKSLWEPLIREGSLLNGYFVSAAPRDNYLKPWPNRGLLQLFNDYFHCVTAGTK